MSLPGCWQSNGSLPALLPLERARPCAPQSLGYQRVWMAVHSAGTWPSLCAGPGVTLQGAEDRHSSLQELQVALTNTAHWVGLAFTHCELWFCLCILGAEVFLLNLVRH